MTIQTISDTSYLLFIRSKEVEQLTVGLNSNMKINLEAAINTNNALQDIHIQLSSCEIPHSYYNFTSALNNINLYVDGSVSLQIPPSHFSIYEMIDYINSSSASAFPYSAEFKSQTNKIIFTNTDSTQHIINFGGVESQGLAKIFGFNITDFTVGSGASIISDYSINFNVIHSLFVHTNLSISNVITTTDGNYRNIIQKIPVNVPFSKVISYNPYMSSQFSSIINTNEIRNIEISLRDQADRLIQLNNVNFELSFLIEIHQRDGGGGVGRRSDIPLSLPSLPNNLPSLPNINSLPNNTNPLSNNKILINPREFSTISSIPALDPVVISLNNEDRLLHDRQQSELQEKLLELEMLDEFI
jgi:hypothetical protein